MQLKSALNLIFTYFERGASRNVELRVNPKRLKVR
jgi:hypothetical protein